MRRLIRHFAFTLVLFCTWLSAVAQSAARYKVIDDFINTNQLKVTTPGDIKTFGRELKRLFTDDELKARAAFYWLTQHIKYDCEGYRSGNYTYAPADVLAKGRAVCSGYAMLMKMFCDELGVECEIIGGFATGISVDKVMPDSLRINHDWNAVKIKGQWKLVDPTWGGGYANNDCTKTWQKLDEAYFLADPHFMIRSHFPENEKWQLLPEAFTAKQFADSFSKRKAVENFFNADSVIQRKAGEKIRFRLPAEQDRTHLYILLTGPGDEWIESAYLPFTTDTTGYSYADYPVKKAGRFKIWVNLVKRTNEEETIVYSRQAIYRLIVSGPATINRPATRPRITNNRH